MGLVRGRGTQRGRGEPKWARGQSPLRLVEFVVVEVAVLVDLFLVELAVLVELVLVELAGVDQIELEELRLLYKLVLEEKLKIKEQETMPIYLLAI